MLFRSKRTILPFLVACGGFTGAGLGFLMQWWMASRDYQMVTQGKPFFSWQAFIPITFECGILGAALTCVVGMFTLNKLPQPYHPVFNVPRFALASQNRFFLCIEASDRQFDLERTRTFMHTLGAHEVTTVDQ